MVRAVVRSSRQSMPLVASGMNGITALQDHLINSTTTYFGFLPIRTLLSLLQSSGTSYARKCAQHSPVPASRSLCSDQ